MNECTYPVLSVRTPSFLASDRIMMIQKIVDPDGAKFRWTFLGHAAQIQHALTRASEPTDENVAFRVRNSLPGHAARNARHNITGPAKSSMVMSQTPLRREPLMR